jgi:hypothetical protein
MRSTSTTLRAVVGGEKSLRRKYELDEQQFGARKR